jgi:hypothetical protein
MSLGFYFESEDERSYTISLCPNSRWDWMGMGSDGHGIPSGINVTFRGIPPGNNPYPFISEG